MSARPLPRMRCRGTLEQRIARIKRLARASRWSLIWRAYPTVARMIGLPRGDGEPVTSLCGDGSYIVAAGRMFWLGFGGEP